ncbi:hypothetical protein D3C78_51840 [compost metagenome]
MLFGAAAESAKAAHRNQKLKKMIDNENKVMQNSVIEFYSGIEKFQYTSEIIDVLLESNPSHTHNFYLDKLSTEFFKVKQVMSTEPMNQAQAIALALAIKELALNFDANEKELKTFISKTEKNFDIQLKELNKQTSSTLNNISLQAQKILKDNSEIFKKNIEDNLSKLDSINLQQKKIIEESHDLLLQKSKIELDRKNSIIEKKIKNELAKNNSKLNYLFNILGIFVLINISLFSFLIYKIL